MKIEKGIKMLLVSSYPPRECGIATFTNDIVNALDVVFGDTLPVEVCALQTREQDFQYPEEVSYVLPVDSLVHYRLVAEKINERNDIGLVCIQHEFGLFRGEYGDHILSFILALNKPIVTVFHTVLPDPDEKRKKVVYAIADLSDKVVVLTKKSKEILTEYYNCPPSKSMVIPHGNHTVLWEQKKVLKNKYGFKDKVVLSTFGLISENKGIETVLHALPEIVARHPEVIYLVIGKTHPEVIKREGEKYRNLLTATVKKLGLENNVIFVNEYLQLDQLLEFLTLSEIYLFSSKDPNQAVSGTFAYAMSSGCAVISTPIPHAVESLGNGNGILLKSFDNPEEFKEAILFLIENKEQRIAMGRNAFSMARATNWENIAIQYRLLFDQLTNREDDLRFNFPPIKLDHIKKLTTDFGILQFSKFSQPDPESGYTLDDNARALINMVLYNKAFPDKENLKLANTYLNFIEGIQQHDGWFDNYKDYNKKLTKQNEEVNLEDANGRALWSLGTVISHRQNLPLDMICQAVKCWDKAIKKIDNFKSPRAIAYALKGLYLYHEMYEDGEVKKHIENLADELLRHYKINSAENWCWYEDYMTYANNVLPEAMMYSYLVTKNPKYKKIAVITFDFLLSHYFMKGQLKVISNRGWFKKQNERVFYGEQPIEVATTIIALDLFYEVTQNKKYKDQLKLAFIWFLGNNHLKQIMYNPENGASYDGLEDKHININQGAESTLCFFKARLIMEKYMEKPSNPIKTSKKKSLIT
ncbi:glycosyltransferase involved in cell wall biosynthesis [Flavobacterium limicola]|uniref:Glycosyltransferase involved in cell wall biosynthesis n=1 Tax=Flavobacterium limicola TaxID=180441 RepID=A0A495S7B7_9FLAO|nr:glycosyltransferase [Flavobacterium limicola]RKS95777.1 glycosyltransferase involved in cell wall biosynthesis [Flavobacterium limicola]